MSEIKNVSDHLRAIIKGAVEEHAARDQVDWDLAMIVNPQGPPAYYLSLTIPSSVLGNYHQGGMIIPDFHQISQDSMSAAVSSALEQLRQARSEALTNDLKGAEANSKLLIK